MVMKTNSTAQNSAAPVRKGQRHSLIICLCTSFIVAALILAAPVLPAKEKELRQYRSVTGLVSDEADNPISGATVTLTDLDSGKKLASYTGDDGRYLFSSLETTRGYEVQATFKGISSRTRKVTTIDPRNKITLNLQIPPPKEAE